MRSDIAADHAIVEAVADDDRALMDRLAALEAEVTADADAQRARKAAAVAKLRDQRVTQTAGDAAVRKRTSARSPEPAPEFDEPVARRRAAIADADPLENLSGALELASKANQVKQELQRTRGKGDKSWKASAVASLALGPIGWLYAGSLRETVPASAAWIVLATLIWKVLPFLMMPVFLVAMPLSAIAGVVYALQYNRAGSRQRLFTGDKNKSQPALPGPRAGARGRQLRGG